MHQLNENLIFNIDLKPLYESLINNNAVIYVGAGASISANLPNWAAFLDSCIQNIKDIHQSGTKKDNLKIAEQLFKSNDFVMAAELINQEFKDLLSNNIQTTFNSVKLPSAIHRAIARIPFSFALTTNYDRLLEKSYPDKKVVFVWTEHQSIFRYIKGNEFAIIKMHGDVDRPDSYILTKKEYSSLMNNKVFNSHIITLLALKTFVFVGSSLRDPDLLKLMEDAKLTYGKNFGPHYAILFQEEVDSAFIYYLKETYNIEVIQSKAPNSEKTESVCSFLTHLSGKVAKISNLKNNETIALNSVDFCFNDIIQEKLKEIINQIGADLGMVVFIDRRDLPGLKYYYSYAIDGYGNPAIETEKRFNSNTNCHELITMLYNSGSKEQKYIYYSGIEDRKLDNDIVHYEIKCSDFSTIKNNKSILLTQIFLDGQCIGIILLESYVIDAFTIDHLHSLQRNTIVLSSIFRKLELRTAPLIEVDLKTNASNFHSLLDSSYLLNKYSLNYLFYEIDHKKGKLVAHYDKSLIKSKADREFFYNFNESSLATHILKKSDEVYSDDVNNLIKEDKISKRGLDFFGISGPILGTPVKIGNHISFILVAWSRKNEPFPMNKIRYSISRLTHLIANSNFGHPTHIPFENAKNFIEFINNQLKNIDSNQPWRIILKNKETRIQLYTVLLKALTSAICSIGRVRLWYYHKEENTFYCLYSFSQKEALVDGENHENHYKWIKSDGNNEYCQFTINRYAENPFAMHQHATMFLKPDPNIDELNKDPNGKWIVGPVVRKNKKNKKTLLGFISCDNHFKRKERLLTQKQDAFQRYAVDLISDLIAPILFFHRLSDER